jgi:hypothetical protein
MPARVYASLVALAAVVLGALDCGSVAVAGLNVALRPSLRPGSGQALSSQPTGRGRPACSWNSSPLVLALRGGIGDEETDNDAAAVDDAGPTGLVWKEGVSVEMLVEHGRAAISKREYSEAADFLSAALARKVPRHRADARPGTQVDVPRRAA